MNELFVMLLWIGSVHGGPATITGFNTMEACRNSIPAVSEFYSRSNGHGSVVMGTSLMISCVALQKR